MLGGVASWCEPPWPMGDSPRAIGRQPSMLARIRMLSSSRPHLPSPWLDARRPVSLVIRRFPSKMADVEIFSGASGRYDFSSPTSVGKSMKRVSITVTRPRKHERVVCRTRHSSSLNTPAGEPLEFGPATFLPRCRMGPSGCAGSSRTTRARPEKGTDPLQARLECWVG